MNRAARKEAMFSQDAVCGLFLDAVAQVPRRFGAHIHGYALMPNHYHLMVEVPRANLSRVMRHIGATFTQAFNRQRGHDGPVFRGRFKNEVVEDDAYWMHLLAYLHLNPVKAALAPGPRDAIWTSHLGYVNPGLRPDWLRTDELLAMFGSAEALQTYVDDVQRRRREAPVGFDPDRFWAPPAGNPPPPDRPAKLRSPDQAIADVASILGVGDAELLARRRGRTPNTGAWLAAWWLTQSTGLTQTAVAERLGVSRPRVSQLVTSLHRLARQDPAVQALMDRLETLHPAG